MLPYVSLCDLYDLDVFPYTADTPTLFPLTLLTTIQKIPRARSIGSQLWTTQGYLDDLDDPDDPDDFPTSS